MVADKNNHCIVKGKNRIGISISLFIFSILGFFVIIDLDIITIALTIFLLLLSLLSFTLRICVTNTHYIVTSTLFRRPFRKFILQECSVKYIMPKWSRIFTSAVISQGRKTSVIIGWGVTNYLAILNAVEEKCKDIS